MLQKRKNLLRVMLQVFQDASLLEPSVFQLSRMYKEQTDGEMKPKTSKCRLVHDMYRKVRCHQSLGEPSGRQRKTQKPKTDSKHDCASTVTTHYPPQKVITQIGHTIRKFSKISRSHTEHHVLNRCRSLSHK